MWKIAYNAITFYGGTDLFGSRGDVERSLGRQSMFQSLFSDAGTSTHVLVRAVGARTDQTYFDLIGPSFFLGNLT